MFASERICWLAETRSSAELKVGVSPLGKIRTTCLETWDRSFHLDQRRV